MIVYLFANLSILLAFKFSFVLCESSSRLLKQKVWAHTSMSQSSNSW